MAVARGAYPKERGSSRIPVDKSGEGNLDPKQIRKWVVVESRALGGERVLVIVDREFEEEARATHPDLVVYLGSEARALFDKGATPPMTARRIHKIKKVFDGVIVPEPRR